MIREEMRYGALSTKVRALYGKRLRYADFERLAGFTSETEILDFLRGHPGWSRAANALSASGKAYIGRVELEAALQDEVRLEYESLSCFVPRQDKELMRYRTLLAERDAILVALRRLKAGRYAMGMPPPSRSVLQGKVDYRALSSPSSYEDVMIACRESIYYSALLHLRQPDGSLPDYMVAESLLHAAYFSRIHRIIGKDYQGETKALLLRAFGEQADMLNLNHILRLKTYFPETDQNTYLMILFPFSYRLRPSVTRAMCAAPDTEAVFALIRQTPYAGSFEHAADREMEYYYRRAFYLFNKRQLTAGCPSIYTAMAYLNLKDLELKALVNVIESVKYNVPFDMGLAKLVGE